MTPSPTPRLFGLKAQRAPVIVLIRRGPAKWSQLIRWHTVADHFDVGQWLAARVPIHRADISPSGEFMIYGAERHDQRRPTRWTTISRPPYWSAVRFFSCKCFDYGGGHMVDDSHYLLNTKGDAEVLDRLKRDGWHLEQAFTAPRYAAKDYCRLFLPHSDEKVGLVMHRYLETKSRVPFAAPYFERYALRHADGHEVELPEVNWADWDHRGRLVYARPGEVFAARPDGSEERLLFAVGSKAPEPLAPPPSAIAPAHLRPFEEPPLKLAKWSPEPRPERKTHGNRKRSSR